MQLRQDMDLCPVAVNEVRENMGELILCGQTLAAIPYYLENASLNIYSLEELSYYIENNLYLLEPDFMSEELCTWIDKELGLGELAGHMQKICRDRGTLSEFVLAILAESGYCSVTSQKQIAQTLREMEHKSDFERGKLRADRYQENGKYLGSIMEYRRLLEAEEENTILVGDVWHNMGSAYARLFLFEEAAACFQRAYEKNRNPESLRECLYAYRCSRDESGFSKAAGEYRLDEEKALEIARSVGEAVKSETVLNSGKELEEWFGAGEDGKISEKLDQWIGQYRKNCRI